MLRVIEDSKTIDECQNLLRAAVNKLKTERHRHVIGFPSGSLEADVYYVKKFDFWMTFEEVSNRYWNACGIGYPFGLHAPAPHVEINIPYSGIDRRIAGAFLEDEAGVKYLGHSGKVGGGTKGISRKNFLLDYPAWSIADSHGEPWQMYVISPLAAPDLASKIAEFTQRSATFRAEIKAGKSPVPKKSPAGLPTFSPEFEGAKSYTTADQVIADCKHGKVVKALREQLATFGISAWNSGRRDLYTVGPGQTVQALFEIKTQANTSSIYEAIGQLMYHGGAEAAEILVAVLPDDAPEAAVARLRELGIWTVLYCWNSDGSLVFSDPATLVAALKNL